MVLNPFSLPDVSRRKQPAESVLLAGAISLAPYSSAYLPAPKLQRRSDWAQLSVI
jgi:hypothetical protein